MTVTIVHVGGTEKEVEFVAFDAPRPWIQLRYPNGGGALQLRSRSRRHRMQTQPHAGVARV